ncbi:ribonuclease H2, subunit C [Diaporthe sp. PMI_573]|nr:ribonuclease H2, subunit C [Diaporthaceae sp. PMI_573]
MEQPMLSVDQHKGSSCDKATPNVLPCRIQHDGPITEADSYWKPSQEPDDKRVAYFRGRKLHGKALRVPEGYRGVVVDKTEPPKPQAPRPDEPEVVDLEAEDEMPLGALETKAEFDEIVIWGHESVADTSSDPYVRGVEEWMEVAEKIHSYEEKGQ